MPDSALIQAFFYNNPDTYPPIVNSARLMAEGGCTLDLFCRDNGERWQVSYPTQTRVRRIDTRARSSWQEYFRFVTRVLQQADKGASLFIGYDMHGFLPARLLATRYRRPLIYHCHDFADHARALPAGSSMVRSFEQRFARTADCVIVPDRERGLLMMQELCLREPPLIVANAPTKQFGGSGKALTDALSARNKHFARILFRQGRIGVGHAIEATLRSMPYWHDRNWGFVLMGPSEPSYLESLSQLVRSLGIEDQFAVLPAVGYDQLADFTFGAHMGHALYEPIHVNNVYITTASNKMMEYMSAGLPVLLSDRPSFRALVEKYRCGLTADENSPDSIAAAVNNLLGNPELALRMGAAGRQAFEQEFCYERQFTPVLEAFRALSVS